VCGLRQAAEREQAEANIKMRNSISEPQIMAVDSKPIDTVYDELRCVLAVIRHGDRTPKQKLKMKVRGRNPTRADLTRTFPTRIAHLCVVSVILPFYCSNIRTLH
jgi:hypothetical protein